jgi:hypothetical protein
MDLSHGKYNSPLAALAETWMMNGDWGSAAYTNEGDGSGCILYRFNRPVHLSWVEARSLMAEHNANVEDLDLLDAEILNAGGVFYQWDSQGFCAAHVESVAQADQTEDALIERNKRDWEDELSGDADEITFTPSDPDGEDE